MMSFDQPITHVLLIPPAVVNKERLYRLIVFTAVQIHKVYLQEEPFKLIPAKADEIPLTLKSDYIHDAIYLKGDKRVWTGGESTQELIFETKPATYFSNKRNTMK